MPDPSDYGARAPAAARLQPVSTGNRDNSDRQIWHEKQNNRQRSDMDYNHAITRIGEVIDAIGVAVIVVGLLISAGAAAVRLGRHEAGTYRHFRQQLGQTILLGLELLVIGDIVRTVAAEPTLDSVLVLAIIVLIRTFLSFSLEVELTGRWPWLSGTAVRPPELSGAGRRPRTVQGRWDCPAPRHAEVPQTTPVRAVTKQCDPP